MLVDIDVIFICIDSSGVDEDYTELEKLLVDVTERKNEADILAIEKKTAKTKKEKAERKLLDEGLTARKRAMQRQSGKILLHIVNSYSMSWICE